MPPKKDHNNSTTTTPASAAATSMNSAEIAAAEQKQALYAANAKLCRLVRRCPWMYDRQHPHYAKKHIMDKSWAKIAKDCDDSVASCKERWRNIRAAFARSINIYKTNSGPNRVKPYYLHTELQFLIQPMLEGREMLTKDVDEIKTDIDELQSSLAAASAAASLEDGESGNAAQHLVEVAPHDVLSDVEADFGFADDETTTATAATTTTTNDVSGGSARGQASSASASASLNHSNESALTTSSGGGGGGGGGREAEARAGVVTRAATNHSLDYAGDGSTHVAKRPRFLNIDIGDFRGVASDLRGVRGVADSSRGVASDFRGMGVMGEGVAPTDADAKFLIALLPDMRAMNARQKIVFKRKIYQSLEEVFETSADFPAAATSTPTGTVAATSTPMTTAMSTTTSTATSSMAQDVVRSVANLRVHELHKLQDFLHDLQRQRSDVSGLTATATRPSINGQTLTVVPRAAATATSTPRHSLRSLRSCNGNANGNVSGNVNGGVAGGNWEQLQPITIKAEVDEDEDVEDFE